MDWTLEAHPNPAHKEFTVSLKGTRIHEGLQLQIMDREGRIVVPLSPFIENSLQVYGEQLKPGAHTLQLIHQGQPLIQRNIYVLP